jgi:hypothetical protein
MTTFPSIIGSSPPPSLMVPFSSMVWLSHLFFLFLLVPVVYDRYALPTFFVFFYDGRPPAASCGRVSLSTRRSRVSHASRENK